MSLFESPPILSHLVYVEETAESRHTHCLRSCLFPGIVVVSIKNNLCVLRKLDHIDRTETKPKIVSIPSKTKRLVLVIRKSETATFGVLVELNEQL
jgi:hypothetical protein